MLLTSGMIGTIVEPAEIRLFWRAEYGHECASAAGQEIGNYTGGLPRRLGSSRSPVLAQTWSTCYWAGFTFRCEHCRG